jgi:ribonuclease HII
VAAAVLLCKPRPGGLDDSKKLSPAKRAVLEARIRRRCAFGIGIVDVADIDRVNIFQATMWAMSLAVERLVQAIGAEPTQVLVDGNLTRAGEPNGAGPRAPSWVAMARKPASARRPFWPRNTATG